MEDLYQELGVSKDCSFEEIKQQFRILARIHHPDMGGDEETFKRIKFAYEVLSDPARRAEYDKTGISARPPDVSQEAKETLCQILLTAIQQYDTNMGDLLQLIRDDIQSGISTLNNNKNDSNVYTGKLELIKSKIRRKDGNIDTDNLLHSFIDTQIGMKRNDSDHMSRRILIAEEMIKILDDYIYGFVELNNEPTTGGGFKYEGET
jgi:curved DNA-binding protein CbpA